MGMVELIKTLADGGMKFVLVGGLAVALCGKGPGSRAAAAFADTGEAPSVPRGFTIIELVVTMIIVGILAVTVLPRFADVSTFESRGFHDETLALVRYAQKSAIAQRRTVCVTVNAAGVTLNVAVAADSATCDTALAPPGLPHGGSGLAGPSFKFRPLGETDQGSNVTLTVAGADPITVDYRTGHAY